MRLIAEVGVVKGVIVAADDGQPWKGIELSWVSGLTHRTEHFFLKDTH